MDIEQAMLEQVRSLTPEQQQEVLDFAAFLRQRTPVILKKKACTRTTQREHLLDGR